jgi:hypothetical protein
MTYCQKAFALLYLILSLLTQTSTGQSIDTFNIDNYVRWIRNYQEVSNINIPLNSLTDSEQLLLCNIIKENMKDSIFDIRWRSLTVGSNIVAGSTSNLVKSELTSIMLQNIYDLDSRIVYTASQNLLELEDVKYTSGQKDTLVDLISRISNPNILVTLYRLCGKQGVSESMLLLKNVSFSTNIPFYQRWVALSSLTRLGNAEAENLMSDYLNRIDISLDAIKTLYPYILFSKSRQNISYLIELIQNNNSGCESSNPNVSTSIPCSYLVLTIVAPEIAELNWEGKDGLQSLEPEEALKKARVFFKNIDNNWSFKRE